mgnify:CR=1 FL=1
MNFEVRISSKKVKYVKNVIDKCLTKQTKRYIISVQSIRADKSVWTDYQLESLNRRYNYGGF